MFMLKSTNERLIKETETRAFVEGMDAGSIRGYKKGYSHGFAEGLKKDASGIHYFSGGLIAFDEKGNQRSQLIEDKITGGVNNE